MDKIALSGFTCFTVKLEVFRSALSNDLNCLLLESNKEAAYYGKRNFPPTNTKGKDRHLYLLVKNTINCFQDMLLRYSARISEQLNIELHVSPGQMTFQKKDYQAVRINTAHTDYLPTLIADLKKIGILFMSDHKKLEHYESVVYFKKYIEFVELQEGVYQDSVTKGRYFFQIPRALEFEEFEQKIDMIKNNCDFHLFDSFLNHLFVKGKVLDFIGIYSEHCDENRFEEFKKHLCEIFK